MKTSLCPLLLLCSLGSTPLLAAAPLPSSSGGGPLIPPTPTACWAIGCRFSAAAAATGPPPKPGGGRRPRSRRLFARTTSPCPAADDEAEGGRLRSDPCDGNRHDSFLRSRRLIRAQHQRRDTDGWLVVVDDGARRRCLSAAVAAAAGFGAGFPALAAAAAAVAVAGKDEEPEECRGGAIVAEAAVPGAYQQVCMTLPERKITLKSTGDEISVLQGSASGTGTLSGRTGVAVWNSGLLLARLLDRLAVEGASSPSRRGSGGTMTTPPPAAKAKAAPLFRDLTVLELGCGTALSSIVASKLGAARVFATDGNAEVVELARSNLERNGVVDVVVSSSDDDGEGGGGRAAELHWGLLDASDYYDAADVILGSDLTYNSGSWRVLSETLAAALKPDGYVLYLALGHSGFGVAGELGGFLSVIEGEGLELVEESSERWPFAKGVSLSKVLAKCVSPEEKAVIDGTGGARAIVLRRKQIKKFS